MWKCDWALVEMKVDVVRVECDFCAIRVKVLYWLF